MSKPTSIYDLEFTDNRGNLVSLADYSGKPILIVNTASKCGFTPQYEGLQKLNEEFREKGLIWTSRLLQFGRNEYSPWTWKVFPLV